jgi:hydroxymethylglutaryl-CoA reductase
LLNIKKKKKHCLYDLFSETEKNVQVMSILSNYVPNCIVRAEVSCPVEELAEKHTKPTRFCRAFVQASSNCRSRTF